MNLNFLKKPINRFLILILAFYLGWYLIYNLWLHPAETLDLFVIDITVIISKELLELFGYTVFTGSDRLIGIDGTGGLWIGDNCNGIALFALFTGFIIAYPGNWRKKLYYIPMGILLIELMNILRVVLLAILDTHSRAWTEFNHTYTFTIVIYGFIFLMWMIWVNKVSDKGLTEKA
ncbi:MAG: Transrane exosortase (Exosortase EpsH) [Bacteroidetes bacterium]|jgi:exosortase family protein XrtF|nr:Transrane exosortase (Exosortase EpsH) [Bacteroidota bacterium]